jgi:hypothetical protein
MREYDSYPVRPMVVDTIIINFIEYLKVDDMEQLRNIDCAWMLDENDDSILYIHFKDHNIPSNFISLKLSIFNGYSYGKSILYGGGMTFPIITSIPDIEDSADNLIYQKMKFMSGSITMDNSIGIFDKLTQIFGNNISLFKFKNDKLELMREFFINSYDIGLNSIKLSVKDRRSKLTFKAPNTFYTLEEFPFIDENLINNVIQDAYGYCRNIKGTCINRYEVYKGPSHQSGLEEDNFNFNDDFIFKFARTITSIKKVEVEKSGVWIEVFPGLGIDGNDDRKSPDYYRKPNPHPIQLVVRDVYNKDILIPINEANKNNLPTNDGRISIYWLQAIKDNPGHLGSRNGNAEKVRMTGIFVNKNTVGEVVQDLLLYYGQLPHNESYFDSAEWDEEMVRAWNEVGICLDKQDNVYNWIEKLQNGSQLGFQLSMVKNLFSVRLDYANRNETFNINAASIMNRDELIAEFNGDSYATTAKINYSEDYSENDVWKTLINDSKRNAILDIYKFEKEYENNCYLVSETDAFNKSEIILETFMNVHPIIKGIKLGGLFENEIKLYSTGFIDFTFYLPNSMKVIQKYMKNRDSLKRIRVKVLNIKRDIKEETIVIDVIQCDLLESLLLDITGEYPYTITDKYEYEIDSLTSGSKDSDYTFLFDGGLQ